MSVKDRLPKIREGSKNVVLLLNKSEKVSRWGLRSLSDPAVNYQIKLEWNGTGKIEDINFAQVSCECHKVADVGGHQPPCEGNSDSPYRDSVVCYHSLASLIKKAENKGQSLSLFDRFSDATNYLNFGGKLIKITSAQGKGYCWGVVSQRKKSDFPGDGGLDKISFTPSLEYQRKLRIARVEMMRGEKEEGIE
jgi:hypothetical protein